MRIGELRDAFKQMDITELRRTRMVLDQEIAELEEKLPSPMLVRCPSGAGSLETVKMIREATGLGLKEASEIVLGVRQGTPFKLVGIEAHWIERLQKIPGVTLET